jgi:hypothetical protein
MNKKANKELGIGIIAFALLLLLVGIFQENPITLEPIDNSNNGAYNNDEFPEKNYLFYLEDFELGTQKKSTQSFPNIKLGSQKEYITTFIEPRIILIENMFRSVEYKLSYSIENTKDTKELLLYSNIEQLSGSNEIEVYNNGKLITSIPAKSKYLPIRIRELNKNGTNEIVLKIKKVPFYNIFSWNKIEFRDFRIVELRKNEDENTKTFTFEVDKENLQNVSIQLVVNCEENSKTSQGIEIKVNDYILTNQNPTCTSRYNRIGVLVPKNILTFDKPNTLTLSTQGYYTLAYSITSTSFNEQESYKFVINDFSEIFDVVVYGDYDKNYLSIKINNKRLEIPRNDYVSIFPYVRYGVNEIEFLQKPLSIKEFVIEKIDYYGSDAFEEKFNENYNN